jgi:hypothetical protein
MGKEGQRKVTLYDFNISRSFVPFVRYISQCIACEDYQLKINYERILFKEETGLNNKEYIKRDSLTDDESGGKALDIFLSTFEETSGEGEPSAEKLVELARKAPAPSAFGNAQIDILSHNLIRNNARDGIVINLKNVSGLIIGKAAFEIVFYDAKGDVIDLTEQGVSDLKKNEIRTLHIYPGRSVKSDMASYAVKVIKTVMIPDSFVMGNDSIEILEHFYTMEDNTFGAGLIGGRINLSVKNILNKTIAMAMFEAVYYDLDGNVLDTIQHKEFELKPDKSRVVTITIDRIKGLYVKSYKVNIIKISTADVEKIQLLRNESRTIESGRKEISGILKNISDVKADTVLVVTFLDSNEEINGISVLEVKNIEPDCVRKFSLTFTPVKGCSVKNYFIDIGEMIRDAVTEKIGTTDTIWN